MPKQQEPHGRPAARRGGASGPAPRVIEGGVRPLPIEVEDGSQPSVVLWVDSQSGLVLAHALVDRRTSPDQGATEALAALEQVLQQLPGASPSGLIVPGAAQRSSGSTVVRTDRQLAALAQLRLARLHVVVEATGDMPMFDIAFEEMADSLAGSPDGPFEWEIDDALLPPLFEAAAEYARREPWSFMLDHPPFAVTLGAASPLPGVETLYGSFMGAGGEVFGLAFYLSLDEYLDAARAGEAMEDEAPAELDEGQMAEMIDQLRRMGAPVDSVPPDLLHGMLQDMAGDATQGPPRQEAMVCFFESDDESLPSYLDWLEEHDVEFAEEEEIPVFLRTSHDADPRNLSAEEARALTIALAATNQFLGAHMRTLRRHAYTVPRADLRHTAQVQAEDREQPVEVVWPAPGYDMARDLAE